MAAASPATVARAHQLADELGRALTLSDFCEVVGRPDFAATLRALEADGGYPETVKSMREAANICRQHARPGAPPGHRSPKGQPAREAPPGGGQQGGSGRAATGPASGPTVSPGGARNGGGGKPGGAPGGRRFGPDLFEGFPWWALVAGYFVLRSRDR